MSNYTWLDKLKYGILSTHQLDGLKAKWTVSDLQRAVATHFSIPLELVTEVMPEPYVDRAPRRRHGTLYLSRQWYRLSLYDAQHIDEDGNHTMSQSEIQRELDVRDAIDPDVWRSDHDDWLGIATINFPNKEYD